MFWPNSSDHSQSCVGDFMIVNFNYSLFGQPHYWSYSTTRKPGCLGRLSEHVHPLVLGYRCIYVYSGFIVSSWYSMYVGGRLEACKHYKVSLVNSFTLATWGTNLIRCSCPRINHTASVWDVLQCWLIADIPN